MRDREQHAHFSLLKRYKFLITNIFFRDVFENALIYGTSILTKGIFWVFCHIFAAIHTNKKFRIKLSGLLRKPTSDVQT